MEIVVSCKNSANIFCFVCGKFCPKIQRKPLTNSVKKSYSLYFGRAVHDEAKFWIPNICCQTCETSLNLWYNGNRASLPFAVPMLWKEPSNHYDDCFFCLTNVFGFSAKNKHKINYPDCASAAKPLPHGEGLAVPVSPNAKLVDEDSGEELVDDISDPDYVPEDCKEPHIIDQSELNDLARDLKLDKQLSEILGSRLQQWNLLVPGTAITSFRHCRPSLPKEIQFVFVAKSMD